MKKSIKIILIALMAVILVLSVTACASDTTIEVSAAPQTTFVKGNDLDLSAGKLTVTKGGATSEIAMNAEGVSVSGYDKNTVGEQELVISYNGAKTTLKVNVVERMVAVGHEANYALGQAFDNKGTLRITKDNGETISVLIKDEKLQLSGFDSATAGKKTVNVVYTDGLLTFNGSFEVNVYAVDNVSLNHFSMKKTYNSHDTKIDITGGYLTVTINSGAETKNLPLKEEWVQSVNFDDPALTDESPKMTQNVTINCFGQTLKFTVNVTLSNVTRIKRAAKTLEGLDWTGDTAPAITDEQGKTALKALEIYNDLYEGDAEYISDEEILTIVRPAAVYGKTAWTASAEQFDALFSVSYNMLTIECENLDETKTQFTALSALENDSALLKYGDVLLNANALKDFGEVTLFGEEVYSKYLVGICSGEDVKSAIQKIDLMLKMHEALQVVPEEWTVESLQSKELSAGIIQATDFAIQLGGLTESVFDRDWFNVVSDWRANDDYFEILYRYYFNAYKTGDDEASEQAIESINSLINVCMPGILETYYLQYIKTIIEQFDLQYTLTDDEFVPAGSLDTIWFIKEYYDLVEIGDKILASEDEMYVTLFTTYQLDSLITNFEINEYGLLNIFGAAYGLPAFDELWKFYIEVVYENLTEVEGAAQKLELLLEKFINLSPEMQAMFLASLNAYGLSDMFVDEYVGEATMFEGLILAHYMDILPENLIADGEQNGIVAELLKAMQWFIDRTETVSNDESETETYMDWFMESMGKVEEAYKNLTASDKAVFDEHFGFFYNKYIGIYHMYDESGNFVGGQEISAEWQAKIDELEKAYGTLASLYMQMYLEEMFSGYSVYYPAFISKCEALFNLYNDIMENAPQEVKDIIFYSGMNITLDEEGSEQNGESASMVAPYETFLYQFRSWYFAYLVEYPISDTYAITLWDAYLKSNLPEYLASLSEFFDWVLAMSNDGETELISSDVVKKIMADYRALSDTEKEWFITMDGYGNYLYSGSLLAYFQKQFASSDSLQSLANDLLLFEIMLDGGYLYNGEFIDISDEETFVAVWESMQGSYDELSTEDKAMFDENLGEMFEYYNDIYEKITGEQTPSEPEVQE